MNRINYFILSALIVLCVACDRKQPQQEVKSTNENAISILEQGSFAVGGSVIKQSGTYNTRQPLKADGQTLHGDHAYVNYQIPINARHYPLVFLHGAGQSAKTWESTPDGREGFGMLFLRQGFSTYLIDQPRRGRAGRSTVDEQLKAVPDEQFWFENFRMGVWPDLYDGSQFPTQPEAMEQFFRQMTPNTGAFDEEVIASSIAALFDKIGEGILITHSQGGGPGWHTAIKNALVKAIVAFEPGSGFIFPEGEVPEPLKTISPFGNLTATSVSMDDFKKLTRVPIIIYYGDYIPSEPSNNWAMDSWRVRLQMARLFAECINRHGGNATLIHLPQVGIKGNSHFLFAEKNNKQLADMLSEWFKENKLDVYAQDGNKQ